MSDENYRSRVRFESSDRLTIVFLCLLLIAFVCGMFFFVDSQELLSYPQHRIAESIQKKSYEYFAFALEYRERRLTLALTYRTFLTSFGFIVGLVLSTVGGLFILRRAKITFSAGAELDELQDPKKKAAFSIATSSPGVLFMLGGIAVMIATQFLAIRVGAPEIYPSNSKQLCHPDALAEGSCYLKSPSDIDAFVAYCNEKEQDNHCKALKELLDDFID